MADVIIMTCVEPQDHRLRGSRYVHLQEIKQNRYLYYASELTFDDYIKDVLDNPDHNIRFNQSWRFIDGRMYD